jgi:L-alanine-DL-glutamate epimerase-like enolase superfamily enzyme
MDERDPRHHEGDSADAPRRVGRAGIPHDWPVPLPSGREVLIRLAASGLNNTDVNTRTGWYRWRARGPLGADGHLHMPNALGLGVHPDEKALGHPVAVYT